MQYNRLRIELNRSRVYGSAGPIQLFNWLTGQTPVIAFGRALQIELLLTKGAKGGDAGDLDTSDITSITAQLRLASGGVIDVAGSDVFNRSTGVIFTITQDAWDNDSGTPSYHAAIAFTAAEMGALTGLTFDATNVAPAALVFTGTTAQGPIPLGAGLVSIYKDGGTGPSAGVAPVAAYTLTNDQINSMIDSRLAAGENRNGVDFTLRGANGWGIRFWVDDSTGVPIPQTTQLPPLP
jgi:hypothetical protein